MADKAGVKRANLINSEKEATRLAWKVRERSIREDWHLRWALQDRYRIVWGDARREFQEEGNRDSNKCAKLQNVRGGLPWRLSGRIHMQRRRRECRYWSSRSSVLAWENPVDRGAWWDVVHGGAKSRTRLSETTTTGIKRARRKDINSVWTGWLQRNLITGWFISLGKRWCWLAPGGWQCEWEVGWKGTCVQWSGGTSHWIHKFGVESGSCQWPVPTHTRCSVFSVEFMNDLGEKIKERMLARIIWPWFGDWEEMQTWNEVVGCSFRCVELQVPPETQGWRLARHPRSRCAWTCLFVVCSYDFRR